MDERRVVEIHVVVAGAARIEPLLASGGHRRLESRRAARGERDSA